MNTLKDFITIKTLLEDINNEDKKFYVLKYQTDNFDLYFDKHAIKRKQRHFN